MYKLNGWSLIASSKKMSRITQCADDRVGQASGKQTENENLKK